MITELRPGLFRVADTCHVYVFRPGPPGSDAVCVDFGSGAVLDHLPALGVGRITHVLMTHHHRDQAQGLPRAEAAGIEIWVPPVEQELFSEVDRFWAARRVRNDYVLLTDRFSLLEPVAVTGTVEEYRTTTYGGIEVTTWPTPGHTPGSVSYLVRHGGVTVACTGDLIHSPGKVWSLAATQWSYTGNEGPQMTYVSAETLLHHAPGPLALLLPSHGEPMPDAEAALSSLGDNLQAYLDGRRPQGTTNIRARLQDPFVRVTDHLLMNTSSESRSWVLLSETGEALLIDYGYDMTTWTQLGGPRHSQRPLLASLPALARHHGVTRVAAALATHYHDDHVAGMNLLRDVTGAQVWAPENVAPVMAQPMQYDLPCQWFEPIPVDRVLRFDEPVAWHEYTITTHPLPGHTLFAGAFEFEVDGVRVLATGDQQDGQGGLAPGARHLGNYQYRNRFAYADYRASAALYRRVAPGLFITGHWNPRAGGEAFLDAMTDLGDRIVDHHRLLLPLNELDLPADGVLARLVPYAREAHAGEHLTWRVEVRNPLQEEAAAELQLVVPTDWDAPEPVRLVIPARADATAEVSVRVPSSAERRTPWVVALDVTIGALTLGQHAEAIVTVGTAGSLP